MADDRNLEILDSVDRFCADNLGPGEVRRRDDGHIPPYDLLPALADLGLIRAPFPEADGGYALPWASFCQIQERLGTAAYFAGSILNRVVCFGLMPLFRFGTTEQKERYVEKLFDGRTLIALALSEPGVGSDARAVTTRAVKTTTGWRITGRKSWISDAGGSSALLTLCRTPELGDKSLTAFLIPTDTAGVDLLPMAKVGNNCMPSFEIGLDTEVGEACVLGPVGEGFKVISSTLAYSRASMSATAVGCAQAACDLAASYARERIQFGKPIAQFQVIRHRLVDMHMEVEKARLLVRELAARIDDGRDTGIYAPMAKVAATEALQFVTDHGMQIMASACYAADSAMQRYWRDARLYSFGEGTNEIQREIAAKHLQLA